MKTRMLLWVMLMGLIQNSPIRCQIVVNELMASNVLTAPDEQGDYDDWFEIYNSGAGSVNIGGCYLTDDIYEPKKWQVPANQPAKTTIASKGYLTIWSDQQTEQGPLHAGFQLSRAGGGVFLIAADGATVLDRIDYPGQASDVSFGRFPDGSPQWGFSPLSTPGRANSRNYPGFSPPPEINTASGFYHTPLSVAVKPSLPNDPVYYTLDGSDPSEQASLYSLPIPIARTTVLRVRTFRDGLAPGPIVSKIYLFDAAYGLPVMTIVTDPDNLFDKTIGIEANALQRGRAWERKVSIDYFQDQTLQFDVQAGLRIQGNTGRAMAKKSFRCYFRQGYDLDVLGYGLFDRTAVDRFNTLVLRAGYDDGLTEPSGTLLRDPLVNELWRRLGNPTSHSLFAALYLNEAFWGIYDVREDIDGDFIRNYFRYGDVDMIRLRWPDSQYPDGWGLEDGSSDDWKDLMAFIDNHSFAADSMFAEAAKRIDLDTFTELMALAHATQYRSWNYGAYAFKEKRDGAKWQWAIWDMDRAYFDLQWNEFSPPSNYSFWVNKIAPKLLQNLTYRRTFINRLSDLLNTAFLPERVLPVLDSLATVIEPEIPAEVKKWGSSMEAWRSRVEAIRDFIRKRPAIVRQQAEGFFHLNGQAQCTVNVDGGNGTIKINDVTVSRFPWTGKYFKGIPIAVTAVAEPGYQFEGWSNASWPKLESITLNLTGDESISAVFSRIGDNRVELTAPKRVKSGRLLPVVVRLRDKDGNIQPFDQTPMSVTFENAHSDTIIPIKRGAGTGAVEIRSASNFTLSVQNANGAPVRKPIEISSVPTVSCSGELPAGDMVWDNTADRLITSDVTIPEGCRLTIKRGTWVMVKKNVNFYVRGRISVEGTADEPVVITSDRGSEPWGGMEFTHGEASFQYCMVMNGGGDPSKGHPTNEDWHTGHQHIFFGKTDSEFTFDQCFFLYSPGKVFGVQDSRVTITNSVTSFVWHGGEFHRALLSYRNSHLMNLPNDDHIYVEDIDTDGLHIDYVDLRYPQYSVIDRCFFVTGKDDAIDHHGSRLKISNCWLEDFVHEGVAASGADTVKIFNTVAMKNDQGFEAGWTEDGVSRGPYVFIDHCVALQNNVGLRIGDSYAWSYRNFMKVTNSILSGNKDNVWNYLNSTHAPLAGALDISYSMTNDADYDLSPFCIPGSPAFDAEYYLLPGSPGAGRGMGGTNLGLSDSTALSAGAVVINEIMYREPDDWPTGDWVELVNPGSALRDISGWILRDDNDDHVFQFPPGTVLPETGYLVICVDSSAFRKINPTVPRVIGNLDYGLGRGDAVRLFSATGEPVDSVAYGTNNPWPSKADGNGYSLELINPLLDNALPKSWRASESYGGSPGKKNSESTGITTDGQTGSVHTFRLYQNYPNPFNPVTRIQYTLPAAVHVLVQVFDLSGRVVETLVDGTQEPGLHQIMWHPVRLSSGIYVCRLKTDYCIDMKKLIFEK